TVISDGGGEVFRAGIEVDVDPGAGGVRVLGDVGERLGDDEVHGAFHLGRRSVIGGDVDVDRDGRAPRQCGEGRVESAFGEHGRVQAAGEVAQFDDGSSRLAVGACHERCGGGRVG